MKKTITLMAAIAAFSLQSAAAELEPATFENLTVPADGYWIGDTEDEDYTNGTFKSGSFEFNNWYFADYGSWAHYGYANLTDTEFTGYAGAGQMKNCVGGGYKSANYGVAYCDVYWGPATITLPDFADGVVVPGMWITNTAWVKDAILKGDGMSPAFGEGDWFKLTMTGYDKDGGEKSVEFYLADYRSENEADRYCINDWRYLDLSELGEIVKLVPSMESTKKNEWGMTTPGYFAFDDLGAANAGSGVEAASAAPEVRVSVANGVAVVAANEQSFTVEAVGMNGVRNAVSTVNGVAEIELPAAGVNVLRVVGANGVKTLKVMQ